MAKLFIENRYGIIPNEILYNKDISLEAKGLFGFIQAKPNEWNFSAERIANETKNSLYTVRKTLKELELLGYLIRKKNKNSLGHWETEYHLFSTPQITENPMFEIETLEKNPMFEIPTLANRQIDKTIVNKTIVYNNNTKEELNIKSNTNVSIVTNTRTREKKFLIPSIEEIKNYCDERKNLIDAEKFYNHYTSNGWCVGKTKMKDWKAAIRTWEKNSFNKPNQDESKSKPLFGRQTAETIDANLRGWGKFIN